jgi:hypothetical protein
MGPPPEVGGYGDGEHGVTEVTLVHTEAPAGEIQVRTVLEDFVYRGALELAREALGGQLHAAGQIHYPTGGGSSEGAHWVTSRGYDRELTRAVATAKTGQIVVEVDGTPVTFELATRGPCWGAAACWRGLAVVIGARSVRPDRVRLARLAGPDELAV